MAEFKLTGKMTVKELKDQFRKEFGGTLRVYNGKAQAEDSLKLSKIGNGSSDELVCRGSRTVGAFETEMLEKFGIKVQVATADDWVAVLDGLTLATVAKIKNQAKKADMESMLAYGAKVEETKKDIVVNTPDPKGITVTGNKKVETLAKEFNEKYPFLRLGVFPLSEKEKAAKGETIYKVDYSKLISDVRSKATPGSITISGQKKIRTLEAEFIEEFGLYVQVCYTNKEGKRYYTNGTQDELTLNSFNEKCEADGCKKNEWK